MGKAVGRVKTVLVSGEGSAVVTTLIATKVDKPDHDRLVFSGTVKFTDAVKNHLTSIILPHVENILNSLKMPYHSYEISVVNPGAVSSSDMITEVSGFSVDSSVFLALLSIELDIPIRQNLSFTGHISSKAGDISPVSSMEAKCDAVIEDQKITEFLFPDPDKDASYKKLKPDEYGSTVASIKSLNGRVKYSSIKNTFELLQNTLGPASIVLSSLKYGYFDGHIDDDHQISGYLKSHNKDRFWTTLEDCLAEKEVENFHTLLAEFSKFHIHRKKYPESLGADLYRLILSMPKHIRSIEGLFPLLPMDSYIRLIQNVAEKDHEDVSFLHDALFDRIERGKIVSQFNPEKSKKAKPESLLQQIIDQINPAHIDSEITRQIDIGRSTFISDRITVDSNREFIDVLTSFYIHMSRHTKTISGKVDKSAMEADALSLSEKVFPGKKYKEMRSSAENGTNGGLRKIFDVITDYLKNEAKRKHILSTFNKCVDPLKDEEKLSIISEVMDQCRDELPENIASQSPERYVEDYEEIVMAWIESKSAITNILGRL